MSNQPETPPSAVKEHSHPGLVESKPGIREPLVEAHIGRRAFGYFNVTTSIVLMRVGNDQREGESKYKKDN
jgi:hypothetical protein